MDIKHSHVILDACCVLNLCAAGNFLELLRAMPAPPVVSEVVRAKELLTLQRLENVDNEGVTQFEEAIKLGLVQLTDFESEEEEETFINYASELRDDGESATGSIAFHREWAIATDDKKAIIFFQKNTPHLQLISTLEIVKNWSEIAKVSSDEVKLVLRAIRDKGRYIPHKNHLLLDWWKSGLNE